jgi:hypothetical protein
MNCCNSYGECDHGPGCPTGAVTLPPATVAAAVRTCEAMAARNICGANAGYQFNGNVLQCFTHRGAKTITAKVTP